MQSVLIVDDDHEERTLVASWVHDLGFEVQEAHDTAAALQRFRRAPADIALCDVSLPTRGGIRLAAHIRECHPATAIIVSTAARDIETAVASLRNDAVDYLLKPFDRARLHEALVLARDWHAAAVGSEELHHALQDRLRSRRASVAAAIAAAQDRTEDALEGLIAMLQLHERDGRGHATRVARLAVALADELGSTDDVLEQLEHGALLHDIGKLDVPASILSKPAPLDDREWRVMRMHPRFGYDLISVQPRFAAAAEIVLSHHEAYDGTGYPRGLGGGEIPFGARVLAVADAYDSMTQPHTQRPAMPPALAVQEIERCSGAQFDPVCAQALGPVLQHAVEGVA